MQSLIEILAKYEDTDKNTIHSYGPVYEKLLEPKRLTAKSVLEVGVRGGGSLRTWADYFVNATSIRGIDNGEEAGLWTPDDDRITVHYGDSGKPETLATIGATYGPFDVCWDDGNHHPYMQVATFAALRPYLADGGIYVVEDVEDIGYARLIAKLFDGTVYDLKEVKGRHDDILVVFHN